MICVSENALRDAKKRDKGDMKQRQGWHLITADPLEKMLPARDFKSYPASNRGELVGFVPTIPAADVWKASVSEKEKIYGPDRTMGATAADKTVNRPPDSIEPVFHNSLPFQLFKNFLEAYCVTGVIDCTPGAGELCKAAVSLKLDYLGLCMTAEHEVKLKAMLVRWVQREMMTEGTSLYDPQWAAKRKAANDEEEKENKKPRGKAKAKSKKTAKKKDDDNHEEDDENNGKQEANDDDEEEQKEPPKKKPKKAAPKKKLVTDSEDSA